MKVSKNEISERITSITYLWRSTGPESQPRSSLYPVGENCIWSYGITEKGTFCFFLESPVSFGCGSQLCTRNIQSKEVRIKNIWFLQLELLEIEDLSIFAKLIEDLILESMNYQVDQDCVHAVVERFELWRSMLSNANQHKAEEKGLWGELYTLREVLYHEKAIDAVRAWTGPDYEVQDFKFANNWIEVKTVASNAFVARISSIKQLVSINTGFLYVLYADEDEFNDQSETVHQIYNDICMILEKEPTKEAYNLFNEKLKEFKYLGFVAEDRTKYLLKGNRSFKVGDSFPRLEIIGDANVIGSVVFDLKLDALKDWEVNSIWNKE